MAFNFLNHKGLNTFFNQLKQIFATEAEVVAVEADTDAYVLNIDYENTLAFDTKEIVVPEIAIYEGTVITTLDPFKYNGITVTMPNFVLDSTLFNSQISRYAVMIDGVSDTLLLGIDGDETSLWMNRNTDESDIIMIIVIEETGRAYVSSSALGEVGSEHYVKISYSNIDLVAEISEEDA